MVAVQKRHIAVNQGNIAAKYLSSALFSQISLPSYIYIYITFNISGFSVTVTVLCTMPSPNFKLTNKRLLEVILSVICFMV